VSVQHEFSRFANHYGSHNSIQQKVAAELVAFVRMQQPKNILDLGCGNGLVYQNIDWDIEHFVGVDFAKEMLQSHPKDQAVTCLLGDFNNKELFKQLQEYKFDRIVSASALQWAKELHVTLEHLAQFDTPIALAIFTSGTFKTLYETAHLPPILQSSDAVVKTAQQYFTCKHSIKQYELKFPTSQALFQYIKRSGVSGGRNVLNYKETKRLMKAYPNDYLEFEVVFIWT
jgi:malonyl-CoA O-methyltransferase